MSTATIHNVLETACRALRVDPSPWAAEPKPELYAATYVALAAWIADRAEPGEHGELLSWARCVSAGKKVPTGVPATLRELARATVPAGDRRAIAWGLACETHDCRTHGVSGKGARAAAAAAALLLGAPFLDALAAEILRLEAVTFFERRGVGVDIDTSTITALPWRGSSGGKLTHLLLRFTDGRYGLVAKTKRRWIWHEGSVENMLATVPDALMESAVEAVLGKAEHRRPGAGADG